MKAMVTIHAAKITQKTVVTKIRFASVQINRAECVVLPTNT